MERLGEQASRAEQVCRVVEGFRTAMLVGHAEDGSLRARPMSIAKVDEHGDIFFVTSIDSAKTDEFEQDDRAAVVLQNASQFVSLSGRAEFLLDSKLVRELWSESWRPWFPEGPDDPEIVVLRVRSDEAEIWDMKGLEGMRYLFEAVRHAVTGKRMGEPAEHQYHRKADLG